MRYQEEQNTYKREVGRSEEIDLLLVFSKVGGLFKRFFSFIGRIVIAVKRRLLLVAVICAVGIGLSFLAYKLGKPYYSSSMTLVLAEIRNQFVENQLSRLSTMIKEDNYEAVAEDLNININTARQIKEMQFLNLDEELVAEDSVLTGSPFQIELSLYDRSLFSSIEPALAEYLESNRYFSKQKRIRQREIENMISKLNNEVKSIDSLKTAVASPTGPVNGFIYGQPIDPTNLYREGLAMYEQQVELEAELDQLDNIQIVNGFTPRLYPTGPNLLYYLAIGGSIGFIIAVIIAVNLEDKKRKALSY